MVEDARLMTFLDSIAALDIGALLNAA